MLTGDEAALAGARQGPGASRYMRDYIDARRNLAEFMLPVMLIVLALSFMRTVLPLIGPMATLVRSRWSTPGCAQWSTPS